MKLFMFFQQNAEKGSKYKKHFKYIKKVKNTESKINTIFKGPDSNVNDAVGQFWRT